MYNGINTTKSGSVPTDPRKWTILMSKRGQIQAALAKKNETPVETAGDASEVQAPAATKSLDQIMKENREKAEATRREQYPDSAPRDPETGKELSNVTSISAGTQTTGERKVSSALAAILEKAAAKSQESGKTEKEESEPKKRGGNRYVIFDETKIRSKLSPQGLFIMLALMEAGDVGLTKKELTEKAVAAGQEKFPTNQPHDRAIGFYLSAFKNEGALAFATGPTPAEVKPAEVPSVEPATEAIQDEAVADEELNGSDDNDEDEEESEDEDE